MSWLSQQAGALRNPKPEHQPNIRPTCSFLPPLSSRSLGDICVSPYSLNWACALAEWGPQCAGYPNQCYAPVDYLGPTADFLYGKCVFTSAVGSCTAIPSHAFMLEMKARLNGLVNAAPQMDFYTSQCCNLLHKLMGTGLMSVQYWPGSHGS